MNITAREVEAWNVLPYRLSCTSCLAGLYSPLSAVLDAKSSFFGFTKENSWTSDFEQLRNK